MPYDYAFVVMLLQKIHFEDSVFFIDYTTCVAFDYCISSFRLLNYTLPENIFVKGPRRPRPSVADYPSYLIM